MRRAWSPGGTVHYTVTVSNAGSADAAGTTVTRPDRRRHQRVRRWTCAATRRRDLHGERQRCDQRHARDVPGRRRATYTITATVDTNPPSQITNTATATPPAVACAHRQTRRRVWRVPRWRWSPVIGITKTRRHRHDRAGRDGDLHDHGQQRRFLRRRRYDSRAIRYRAASTRRTGRARRRAEQRAE